MSWLRNLFAQRLPEPLVVRHVEDHRIRIRVTCETGLPGLLPFEVPADSMLTIFWNGDWDAPASSRDGTLVIHPCRDLEPLEPPEEVEDQPGLMAITSEIIQTFPVLREALEIDGWEFEEPHVSALQLLTRHYPELFSTPEDTARIGGWPLWIQNAPDICFVAQISSNEDSDFLFGDGGSLYIHGHSPESLEAVIQCY